MNRYCQSPALPRLASRLVGYPRALGLGAVLLLCGTSACGEEATGGDIAPAFTSADASDAPPEASGDSASSTDSEPEGSTSDN